MFQAGDWVVYGIHGVCRVIGTEKQLVNRKRTQFLVLEPLNHGESRFYLPTENPTAMAKLKPVLTKEELLSVLGSEDVHQDGWIQEEHQRKQYYRELIGSGDRIALLKMVSALYRYRADQIGAGRKFHQSDDNFLRDAEKLLASEIALVMELTPEAAREYLRQQLGAV
jgi:CarD family transcriptional regulator